MAAELHFAEDALALHLLLQHLESLVDIVVTDENLHVVFSSSIERLNGRTVRCRNNCRMDKKEFACRRQPRIEPSVDI